MLQSTTSNNYNAIDPELVIDASGNPWLAFGSFWSGLKIVKLDKNTMKPTGSISSIAARPNNGERLKHQVSRIATGIIICLLPLIPAVKV